MKLSIRELDFEDLPKVKELQKNVQGSPDVGEEGKIWIENEECSFIGALIDDEIVGVANLRKKTPKLAWLEGIRVHPKFQKMGIGVALTQHLLNVASERNFPRVAYATQADNVGSCRLGAKLGFNIDGEMDVAYCKPEWFQINVGELDPGDQYRVPLEKGIEHLSKIPNCPPREICIGWNYIPKDTLYFEQFGDDLQIFMMGDSFLLQYHERSTLTNEIAFIKSIVYGGRENIVDLLNGFIRRSEKFKDKVLICLSHKNLTDVVCSSYWTRGQHPTTVLLIAKDI